MFRGKSWELCAPHVGAPWVCDGPRHTHRLRGTAKHRRFRTPVFTEEACAHTHGHTRGARVCTRSPGRSLGAHTETHLSPRGPTRSPLPPSLPQQLGPAFAILAFISQSFLSAEAFKTLQACLRSCARTLCLGSNPAFQKDRECARLRTGPAVHGASSSPGFLKGQLGSPLEQDGGCLDRGQPASLLPPPTLWLLVPQHGGPQ